MLAPFREIHKDLKSGALRLPDVVSNALDLAKANSLNAFLELFESSAKDRANEIQERIDNGKAGRLAGMIIAIKDNICYQGHKVSASSHILEGFESLYSATVVERLLAEDAIILGRTNCDEFAMGSSNENSFFGPVKNPFDENKVPGGSSGGSAVSVASGICHVALGSDTGGSIRQPASFTNTIGFKPTYGRISRHGLIAYASSFDQIGPFGKEVYDVALVTEIMAGKDDFDSTLSFEEVPSFSKELKEVGKKRFAYLNSYVNHEGLSGAVRKTFMNFIDSLKSEGHEVLELDFTHLDQLVPTYYVLTTAEASSNLARYDGIHYGYRHKGEQDLRETYVNSRSEGFGEEVKRRIMLGTYVLSAGYYDAYYTKAQKVRRLVKEETLKMLDKVDFIISPTTPHSAFEIGSQVDDPIKMYLEDIFTVQANICGFPAISLPIGNDENGMPFGLQLMSRPFSESELLSFSNHVMNKSSFTASPA